MTNLVLLDLSKSANWSENCHNLLISDWDNLFFLCLPTHSLSPGDTLEHIGTHCHRVILDQRDRKYQMVVMPQP